MESSQFDHMLNCLLLNDNNARKQAEQHYNVLKRDNPELVAFQLVRVLEEGVCAAADPAAAAAAAGRRALAAVLLRLLFAVRSDFWPRLSAGARAAVQAAVLAGAGGDPARAVRRKLAHAAAVLAAVVGAQGWPEAAPAAVRLCGAPEGWRAAAGLHLLGLLAEFLGEVPGLGPGQLAEVLGAGLARAARPDGWEAAAAALLAAASALQDVMDPEGLRALRPLLPGMLGVVEAALQKGDEATAQEALAALAGLAEKQPAYLRHALPEVGRAMLAVASHAALEPGTRQLALELLIALCEHLGPALRRKAPHILEAMVPLTLDMLMQVEDDPEWPQRLCFDGEDEDEMGGNLSEVAATALDRMAAAMGPEQILQTVFPAAAALAADAGGDWRRRRAGALAVGLVAQGARDQVYPLLGGAAGLLRGLLLPLALGDPHPRARDAALQTLAVLSEDLKDQGFQREFAGDVLPALAAALGGPNAGIPRLQALACSAVTSFCAPGSCDRRQLAEHAPALLEGLAACLQSPVVVLRTDAVTAVAMLAAGAGELFGHFYPKLQPLVQALLAGPTPEGTDPHQAAVLKGKAMEALALMGAAVGPGAFRRDGHALVRAMLQALQDGTFRSGEPQFAYALTSCARVGAVLGAEFAPYLPPLLALVLQVLSREIETSVVDADEAGTTTSTDKLFAGKDVVRVNVRGAGDQLVALNTAEIQEKENCAQALYQLVQDAGPLLAVHVAEVAPALPPLLRFRGQETLQIVGAAAMPKVLDAAVAGATAGTVPPELPQRVFDAFLHPLLEVLRAGPAVRPEEALEPFAIAADAAAALLRAARGQPTSQDTTLGGVATSRGFLPSAPLAPGDAAAQAPLLSDLRGVVAASLARSNRRSQSFQANGGEDYDEDTFEEAETWEKDILTSVLEGSTALLEMFKQDIFEDFHKNFGDIIQEILPQNHAPVSARSFTYCMAIAALENGGPGAAAAYMPTFLPSVIGALGEENAEVRQCAAYGCGAACRWGGALFDAGAPHALQGLFQMLAAEGAQEEENGAATDNAAAAVLKCCLYRPDLAAPARLMGPLLGHLPLRWDLEEAHDAHARLVDMIADGNKDVIGENFASLPSIMVFLAEIMKFQEPEDGEEMYPSDEELWAAQLVTRATRLKAQETLARMNTLIPVEIMKNAFSQLNDEQKCALQMPTELFRVA